MGIYIHDQGQELSKYTGGKVTSLSQFNREVGYDSKNAIQALRERQQGKEVFAGGFVPNFAVPFALAQKRRMQKLFPNAPMAGETIDSNAQAVKDGLSRAERQGILKRDRGVHIKGRTVDSKTGKETIKMSESRLIQGASGPDWFHGRIEKPEQAGKLKKIPTMGGQYGFGSYFYDKATASTKWIRDRMMDQGAGLEPAKQAAAQKFFEENKKMVGTLYKFHLHRSNHGEGAKAAGDMGDRNEGKFAGMQSRAVGMSEAVGADIAVVPNPSYQFFRGASVISRPNNAEYEEYKKAIKDNFGDTQWAEGSLDSIKDPEKREEARRQREYSARPDQVGTTSFELWKKDDKKFTDHSDYRRSATDAASGLIPNFKGAKKGGAYTKTKKKPRAASATIGAYQAAMLVPEGDPNIGKTLTTTAPNTGEKYSYSVHGPNIPKTRKESLEDTVLKSVTKIAVDYAKDIPNNPLNASPHPEEYFNKGAMRAATGAVFEAAIDAAFGRTKDIETARWDVKKGSKGAPAVRELFGLPGAMDADYKVTSERGNKESMAKKMHKSLGDLTAKTKKSGF